MTMTLRYSFAGAVAVTVLATAAGAADMQPVLKAPGVQPEQQATGYIEVYTGWASTRQTNFGETERLNGWALGGAGRGNYWVSRDVSVQVDAQAEGTSNEFSGCCGHCSTHSYLVGSHWSWRNPQQSLFGVFGAVGDSGTDFGFTEGGARHGLIGGEAQWYWHQFTLYGQVGYETTLGTNSNEVSANAWFLRGTGRYFINPNFLIEGTVMYANGKLNDDDICCGNNPSVGFQTWTWGAKAEWRFPTAPFSVFAKYQGSETK